ncbi:ferredoxin [Hyaloscypha variabilis F]|uniref:Ferredoxin n=1 Tax=Hyaloscypha variabilis (strain UAMH 11265 / GT02V1 / F) TaxID=1149755 RepID=A0A2J6RGA7_HYAVF|nr:ferredoxin [Hyaloscypha variabilis F]
MSARRSVARNLAGLRRGMFAKLCARPYTVEARAPFSTTRITSTQHPFAFPTSHSAVQRTCYPSTPTRSLQAQRSFSATSAAAHGHLDPPKPGEELYVTFVDKDGDEHKIAVSAGNNLLEIAQAHDIEMEGACEGSCSCSTCHVIVEDEELYDKMEEASDDENDMLDLAFGLTETSRLGCQVVMSKELDGLRVRLPSMTRNMQASDFSKKS